MKNLCGFCVIHKIKKKIHPQKFEATQYQYHMSEML